MVDNSYPVIIQTWVSGRGSVLLHGAWPDMAAIKCVMIVSKIIFIRPVADCPFFMKDAHNA